MKKVIKAVSKYNLSDDILREMTQKAIGDKVIDFSAKELAGGLCNAVYLICANGEKYVAKIAPPKIAIMMRHERDIIKTEAEMLELMERLDIPAPRLIAYDKSCELVDVPYIVMTYVDGEPLMFIEQRPSDEAVSQIKFELGAICYKISTGKVDYFGIPGMPETHFNNNADFILSLFKLLIDDCVDENIALPSVSKEELIELITSFRKELNEVECPCVIHTDTWEGNIMVKDDILVGLIDFAAMLYGDPLMNHDFHDFSPTPNPHFMKGYGLEIHVFTRSEWIRIIVYKIWQRLGMIVERIYRHYEDKNLYFWVLDEFEKEINNLKKFSDK